MNETEAKVRCLELAAQLNKPTGDYSAQGVVDTAMLLYTFIQAPAADKPSKVSKAKQPDIMS